MLAQCNACVYVYVCVIYVFSDHQYFQIIPQLRSSSYVTPADLEVILQSDDRLTYICFQS